MTLPLSGAKIRASDLATIFPTGTDAWTSYTPVITQSNTPTISVEFAQWMKIGRLLVVQLSVSITSAGTAANAVLCTFPSAAGSIASFRRVGGGAIFDGSASTWYEGMALWNNATTFKIQAHNTAAATPLGAGGGFTAALASGDLVCAELMCITSS